MAQMYPSKEDLADIPYAELRVYEQLEKLNSNFTVFHSVQWLKKGNKWKSTWKENDFLFFIRKNKLFKKKTNLLFLKNLMIFIKF